ncbi:ribonucleotide-diphosphate reductase subunit beta [Candidatus Peribacteria bacterium]|nr:ribonucleotide-diphosphate reductase subunit beta [Candidatus Peribacteria bacterium]
MTTSHDAALRLSADKRAASEKKRRRGILAPESLVDPNKFLPITYPWARQCYKDGIANNWIPEEVAMMGDIEQWRSQTVLSEDERRMILWNLGFFSTAESLTANNIVLTLYKYITNPECRQYLLRQAYEEAVHNDMFVYICDSLSLDPDEVYSMYETIPSIAAKDEFVINMTRSLLDPAHQIDIETLEGKQTLVSDLIGFYVIMEGIFFYAGFAMMLSLMRQQKMVGVAEQFQYTLRDESVHLAFGQYLINAIVAENPELWTPEFQAQQIAHIRHAVELEYAYAQDALPRGILGLRSDVIYQYLQHIADRRLERINLPAQYGAENPFPWMSEIMDLNKEKNFFETRVTEYQHGSALEW